MTILHINIKKGSEVNLFQTHLILDEQNKKQIAKGEFSFTLPIQERENIRWYLEDFINYPYEHAGNIKAKVEGNLLATGRSLFQFIFKNNEDTWKIWSAIENRLDNVRLEISTDEDFIPWELLIDPQNNKPLALHVSSFIRTIPEQNKQPFTNNKFDGSIRILVVIPRIGGGPDTSLQSTAMRILTGLDTPCWDYVHINVLHPPTLENLNNALRKAKENGKPYHIIHYDGHGTYLDPKKITDKLNLPPQEDIQSGEQGFLLLENIEKPDLIGGLLIGRLMSEFDVPLLSLNTCHSAFPGVNDQPLQDKEEGLVQQQAFDSLTRNALKAGAHGVILIPYLLGTDTIANFVTGIYIALSQGYSLGEAAGLGRQYMNSIKDRGIGTKSISLQDWWAPVIYEPVPLSLSLEVQSNKERSSVNVSLLEGGHENISDRIDQRLANHLPKRGLYGRDEMVLNIDRAFDYKGVVLLYGEDGIGKTSTAAMYAQWYMLNNISIKDSTLVIYTPIENCHCFTNVLESFGQVFEEVLLERNISWQKLDDLQRQKLIQDIFKKIPLLWVWDNLETLSGSHILTWEDAENEKLIEFLHSMDETMAKFLLISNNAEENLLGDTPIRLKVPPLAQIDQMRVIWSYMKEINIPVDIKTNWHYLFSFIKGNPSALELFLKQASATQQLDWKAINRLITKLDRIAQESSDDSGSPVNGLIRYAINNCDPDEQRILALLSLFYGFVDIDALCAMANPKYSWHLPEIAGLSREKCLFIFNRAVEMGLLTHIEGGYYIPHTVLPNQFNWFYHQFFTDLSPMRALVEVVTGLSRDYMVSYRNGNKDILGILAAEETNLLTGFYIAYQNKWLENCITIQDALREVFVKSRRLASWSKILEDLNRSFVNPKNGRPLREHRTNWIQLNDLRVEAAKLREIYSEAEDIQNLRLEWDQSQANAAIQKTMSDLNEKDRGLINNLIASFNKLGDIYKLEGSSKTINAYEKAFDLTMKFSINFSGAEIALKIADGYISIPGLQNLTLAEDWIKRSLDLRDDTDEIGRSHCITLSGKVAFERFVIARKENKPQEEQLAFMNEALGYYFDALDLTPRNTYNDLGNIYEAIGFVYIQGNNMLDTALEYYNKAIQYKEQDNDIYGVSRVQFNLSVTFLLLNRFQEGNKYALDALHGYESLGNNALREIHKTRVLIFRFQQMVQNPSNNL